jgi:hypothetical protein
MMAGIGLAASSDATDDSARAAMLARDKGLELGHYTLIIPSHDLVVVRLGHFKGERHADDDLSRALMLLMRAVPAHLTTTKPAN